MWMLKTPMVILALVLVSSPYMLASAESSSTTVEATGNVVLFNNSPHSGLWAAEADVDSAIGDIVSVFKNDTGDIFVVTVRGEDLVFDEQSLRIAGTAIVAENGLLLRQGNGTATISESGMQIRVDGDIVLSGHTVAFEMK